MDKGKNNDEMKGKSQNAAHRTRKEEKNKDEIKDVDCWDVRDRTRLVLWSTVMD